MDQDVLINAIDAPGIKSAYESNEDTNAFTDSLLTKLENLEVLFFEGEAVPAILGSESENSDWTLVVGGPYDGAYTTTIAISGLLDTDTPIVDLDLNNILFTDWEGIETDWALVKIVETTDDDELTLYASEEPTKDLYIVVKVVR
jgi:broad specificity phosphatase PhoE